MPGDGGIVVEAKLLESFHARETRIEETAALSALGPLGHLRLEQRRQIGKRCLLLARGLGDECPKTRPRGRQMASLARAATSASSAPVFACALTGRLPLPAERRSPKARARARRWPRGAARDRQAGLARVALPVGPGRQLPPVEGSRRERAPDRQLDPGPRSALALLGKRQRAGERPRLAPEQLEVVIERGGDAESALCALVASDLASGW